MNIGQKQRSRVPISDEEIIRLYWSRDEKAIDETDFKYHKYLYSIAYNILCDRLDSEECLNDTYLGVWNAIPPTRPNRFKTFLTIVMRRTAINRYHKNLRAKLVPSEMTVSLSEIEDYIGDGNDVDEAFESARLGSVISDFVRSLSERRQFIFMSRYYVADTVDAIASDLGVSRSTVNKELAAIRGELKEKLESEGYSV